MENTVATVIDKLNSLKDLLTHRLIVGRDSYLRYPARLLLKLGFTPTILNVIGMLLGVMSGLAIILKFNEVAFRFLLLSSLADALDGPLARDTKTVSQWGAILDASCDRVVDTTIYAAILTHYVADKNKKLAFLTWLNLVGAVLTSYIRARSEASYPNRRFALGILPRPGRLLILLAGLKSPEYLGLCLSLSGSLSIITIFQRLWAAFYEYVEE